MAMVAMAQTGLLLDRYVVDVLMRDLVGHDHTCSAFVVYLALHAASEDGEAAFSYRALADFTGLSKRTCQNAIAHLVRRELVEVRHGAVAGRTRYKVLRPWRRRNSPASSDRSPVD